MLEDDDFADGHSAACGGGVVDEHHFEGIPEDVEVFLGEAGARSETRHDEAVGLVESVRDGVLATHGAFFFLILRVRDGHAGDGVALGINRVNRAGEGELDRSANLSARQLSSRKDCTKGSHIEEGLAHQSRTFNLFVDRLLCVFIFLLCSGWRLFAVFYFLVLQVFTDLLDDFIEDSFFTDEDVIARFTGLGKLDAVTDFALEANVRDKALVGVRVKTGEVAGIGVAVGVTIEDIEEEDEVVTVLDGVRHDGVLCLFKVLMSLGH